MNPISERILQYWRLQRQAETHSEKATNAILAYVKKVNGWLDRLNYQPKGDWQGSRFNTEELGENYLQGENTTLGFSLLIHVLLPEGFEKYSTGGIFLVRFRRGDAEGDGIRAIIDIDNLSIKRVATIIRDILVNPEIIPSLLKSGELVDEKVHNKRMAVMYKKMITVV